MGRSRLILAAAVVSFFVAPHSGAGEGKLYRWVDNEGNIHYSDHVPPEYSELGHHILNSHGVSVDVVGGEKTADELAELLRQAELKAQLQLEPRDRNISGQPAQQTGEAPKGCAAIPPL
jgi:hypothetical protein